MIRNEDRGLGKDPQMPGADRKGYSVPEKAPKWAAHGKYAHISDYLYIKVYQKIYSLGKKLALAKVTVFVDFGYKCNALEVFNCSLFTVMLSCVVNYLVNCA